MSKLVDCKWSLIGLKKNLNLSVEEKIKLIDADHSQLSISRQCILLDLNRSSYYYDKQPLTAEQLNLIRLIDERYTQYPAEGARRLAKWLKQQGYSVGRYQVSRLMKIMGIEAIYPKPDTSAPARKPHKIYPYLLSEMEVSYPDQVWCSDITYVRLRSGFCYLTVIMDWYSRYVLSWELSTTLDSQFCVTALERALRQATCDIMNSDQGAQYTSRDWIETLKSRHISISMDGKGRCYDNIFVERLWRTVKYECLYLQEFDSPREVEKVLEKYFYYYNHERLHQSLDYQTPYSVYSNNSLKRSITV
jgi:putative transposase